MNHQSKLYASGLRPVYRLGTNTKWKRQSGKISWIVLKINRINSVFLGKS